MRQILTAHDLSPVTEISERVSDSYNHPEGVAAAFIEQIRTWAKFCLLEWVEL